MSQVSALQSLDLILEDVSAETNLAINSIEQYAKSNKNSKALKKSIAHLQKLKGVFTLLEMPGAERLLLDCINLLKSLPKRKPTSRDRLLGMAATAMARLMRYSEHVNQKPFDMPQLLLPSINELRASANVPLLSESVFFHLDGQKPRQSQDTILLTSEESAAKSRHFRQKYQIGLIEVLRQTNLKGGLNMMKKAIVNLDNECPRPQSPNLWWIAEGLLQAFVDDSLTLNKPRLKIFSRIDRQIRKVENKSENLLEDNKLEVRMLTKEMLYLVSIADSDSSEVKAIKAHFEIPESEITDKLLQEEQEDLRGPSDQDYKSIAEALMTEIENIENTLRNSRDDHISHDDLLLAQKQMENLNNLLKILQVDDQSVRLSVAIDLVDKSIEENKEMAEKDFNILFIVLDSIKNSVDQSELAKYAGRHQVKREKLSPKEKELLELTEVQVKKLMGVISDFVKNNRTPVILKPVDGMLEAIDEGFAKFKVKPAKRIIHGCRLFVRDHLIKNPQTVGESSINLFADIIGSFEFYLETLTFTTQPSERILQFAENSLQELNRLNP